MVKRFADAPETNVAIFAFLVNLPWELAQVPLYAGMATARHWSAILVCGAATLGDVVIALAAFWAVASVVGARRWVLAPTRGPVVGFVVAGLLVTIVTERLATGPLGRWAYAEGMPLVPLLEVGLSPLLQWIVLPLLVVWFVRRQLT
jgi:hypothetical protein